MRAVVIYETGGPEVLQLVDDFPRPSRGAGQVLIRAASVGVNPVDVAVRGGALPPMSFPKVLGGDVAGVVEEADAGSQFKKGDRVMALTPGFFNTEPSGTYAEFVVAEESWLARVPGALPLEQAGGLPLVGLTAWQGLQQAKPRAGQRVLITAASGGVGHIAMQDVAALYGAPGRRFDLALDCMGTRSDLLRKVLSVTKPSGHVAHVLNRGATAKADHEAGRGPAVGTVFVQSSGEQLQQLADLVGAEKMRLEVSLSLPLEQAGAAHMQVDTGHTRGKVVLTV
eukprot:scaffold3.g6514.t1